MLPHEGEGEDGGPMDKMGDNEAQNIRPGTKKNKYTWGPWKFLGWYYSGCKSGACSVRWTEDSCAKKAANTPECMGHFTRWHMSYDGKYRHWNKPYSYEYCYCIGAPIQQEKLYKCTWCERSKQNNWHW